MFKQVLAATALAALAACGGGGGGASGGFVPLVMPVVAPAPVAPTIDKCSVALWGDSIVWGAVPSGQIPETMAKGIKRLRPAYRVVDSSESGTGAVGRRQFFLDTPITTRVVVIEWGINDAVTTTKEAYKQALTDMVAHVKAAGSVAVITGLSYPTKNFRPERYEFNQYAFQVTQEQEIDFGLWDHVAYEDGDNDDVIHPGQAYSTRLVEAIVRSLDRVNEGCAK